MRMTHPRVVLVGPPLDASGGIGRVMSYVLAALPAEARPVRVLDTRGHSRSPVLSLGALAVACMQLSWIAATDGCDVVHVNVSSHGSTLRKGVVVRLCRALRRPVVLHLHASSYPRYFDGLPRWARRAVRSTFATAVRVIVLSEWWRDYAHSVLGVPADRIVVLPNATPGPLHLMPRHRPPGEPLSVLFLGRLGVRKGVPDLLAALTAPDLRDRRWRATLAGDGNVEHYRAQARRLGLDGRVTFTGWLDPDEVEKLLAQAHVLVLPSYEEGLPMSIIESLAWGVPVVSTPVGGIPEIVTDSVDGLLVAPGDSMELAATLVRLLDDEDLRWSLAVKARGTWEDRFTITSYATALADEWMRATIGDAAQRGAPEPVRVLR